ncbi:hypothetical protein EMIT0P395_30221 [Pseudomonas sp. IT-P395]
MIRRGFFVRAEIAPPHPSPLPREREPICGAFRICVRHDGSGGAFLCGLKSHPLTPAFSRGRGSRFVVLSEFVFDTMDQAGLFVLADIAAPHPSPLPKERGPICGVFHICVRLGGSGRRIAKEHLGQSPLPLGEG